jgi:hypothetical protein
VTRAFTPCAGAVHGVFNGVGDDQRMSNPEPATRPAPDPTRTAVFAAALTVLFPGAGHALVRDWARAGIWALGWVVVAAAGGGHSAALVVLGAIATIDAYVRARELTARAQEARS